MIAQPKLPAVMRFIVQFANLRSTDPLDRSVEEDLRALLPFVRIDEAHVRIEQRPDASPAYRASAHLMIPGPDLRAEAVDHTPYTAWAKVLMKLRVMALERADRRTRRHAQPRAARTWRPRVGLARA